MFDNVSEDLFSKLGRMRGLRSLELRSVDVVGPASLNATVSHIASLTQLSKLCFECVSCTARDAAVPMLRVLTSLTGLHHLELNHCQCTSEHVVAVAANLTNLTHLTLGLLQEENVYTRVDPATLCMLTLLTGLQELVFSKMPVAKGLMHHFSSMKKVTIIG
jgi:hypothetical protein